MSDFIQLPLQVKHHNNGLFADYYLNEIVPTLPEWDEALLNAGKMAFADLKALREAIQPTELDEAQLEELWVKPVLASLDHHYAVQVKIRYRERGHRRPDYLFLTDEVAARAVTSKIYAPDEIAHAHALAVGDAKHWHTNLDQSAEGQRNPSQQIDEYLRYSELPWGILTNGQQWRLYHRETSKYNTYYAVDLESLLEVGNVKDFLYFYAFFRRQAFITEGWLAKVLQGSEDFAQKLTNQLEGEVYNALEMIAQGFLDYRRNRLTADAATLRTVYEQSLVLLYRLLFTFYAESRQTLPIEHRDYQRGISLYAIKQAIRADLDLDKPFDADDSRYYARLKDLFFNIDQGNDRYGIPAYNGRLFSDVEHPFLARYGVGDAHLVPALDKLARVDVQNGKQQRRVFVDYRDLDIRHLGSIYEKLLEYELDIAREPLTTTGKDQRYAPAQPGDVVLKQPGQVFLRTGSNERKITGSYYTPDYIVRFIVEKSLEPLLTAITTRHADQDEEGHWHVHNPEALLREVLALNVLDPATGSGHFVVDATAYIAEWLRGLGLRPADLGDEDELVYWKRQVASACIYAVDINPLAVELAKLSLWLATLAKGKPLSFLDHHIRLGNSLVGANISDVGGDLQAVQRRQQIERQRRRDEAVGQLNMFADADFAEGMRFAVASIHEIEHTIADHVRDVKRQEQLYTDLTARLSAWQQVADVWTARYFGLDLTDEQWQAVRQFTTSGVISPAIKSILNDAQHIAGEQRFFHWELAFPEIFFDASGAPLASPGFDAVVGNPPYVRQERIQPMKPFLQAHYAVYSGTADLFLYFYERGLEFLKADHRLGYITSGTYMNSNSAKPFRQYIHDRAGLEWVANFGENQPFRGAEMVYPTIAVMRHGAASETFRNLFVEGNVPFAELSELVESGEWVDSLSEATGIDEWRFQSIHLTQLFTKLTRGCPTLGEHTPGMIYRGVVTGLNDAFIIDEQVKAALIKEDSSSKQIIKPLVRGQDLRPWHQIQSGQYLIFTRRGIEINSYPAIRKYLEQFRSRLEPKPDSWDEKLNGTWHGRKAGPYAWYEIQDQIAYFEQFDKPKILSPDIGKLPRYSWDTEGLYCNDKGTIIVASPATLAMLSSRVCWFVLSQIATPLRLRAGLWQYQAKLQFVERLPIPELTAQQENDLAAIAEAITALARQRYQLHEETRRLINDDFGAGEAISTRVALYAWWNLADDAALNDEIKRQFQKEIPLGKRAEWRSFLAEQQAEHKRLTDEIIAREIRLNDIVYDAFDLTPEERNLIEETTKYPYGEV